MGLHRHILLRPNNVHYSHMCGLGFDGHLRISRIARRGRHWNGLSCVGQGSLHMSLRVCLLRDHHRWTMLLVCSYRYRDGHRRRVGCEQYGTLGGIWGDRNSRSWYAMPLGRRLNLGLFYRSGIVALRWIVPLLIRLVDMTGHRVFIRFL